MHGGLNVNQKLEKSAPEDISLQLSCPRAIMSCGAESDESLAVLPTGDGADDKEEKAKACAEEETEWKVVATR